MLLETEMIHYAHDKLIVWKFGDLKMATVIRLCDDLFSKGKQCFFVMRQNCYTIQAMIRVTENISKQMVKFAAK